MRPLVELSGEVVPKIEGRLATSAPRAEGWVELICGPMFSGKTEELIRRLRRAVIARQPVQTFKHRIDVRYAPDAVVSHSEQRLEAEPVATSDELWHYVAHDTRVVGVDEAQFFDVGLVDVCEELAIRGVRVIVAGLDLDHRGQPFEPVLPLLARAEYVTKLLAICARCSRPASRSLRRQASIERVEVGASELYEAVCRSCHVHEAR